MSKRKAREKEILEVAIEIFAQKGYKKTHVSDIVSEVGIAQGTFYLYFNSKKDLFLKLIDEFTNLFIIKYNKFDFEEIETVDEFKNVLYKIFQMFFKTYKENSDLAKIILREAVAIDNDFEKKLAETYVQLKEKIIKKYYNTGNKRQFFLDYDFEIIVSAIIGMIEMTAHEFFLNETKYSVNELAENLTKFVCDGFLKNNN